MPPSVRTAVAIPVGGWHWMREGIEKLIVEREIGIEILMMAATVGAATLGLWDEAAALVVLYGAAEGLEEYTYARTRSSIRSLLDLAPKEARVLEGGAERTISAEQLRPGERFLVRPGEGVVIDGVIVEGRSSLGEAPVTGESMPVEKGPGAKVFAGSINAEGALTIEATAAFADSTLSRIIHLVEQAQEQKGRAQQWIDRFGRRYSPAVLAAAALLLIVPFSLGLPLEFWANRAVVLLVAAAPCALVMSMPLAMAAGIGSAGRRGILIKGGVHLEFGHKARAVSTQNIVLSIAILVLIIPLAVIGLIGVATAVLVHESAELLAVANGLRAGRVQADAIVARESESRASRIRVTEAG